MGSVEADDERQIAVADDWQLQRLAQCSSTDTVAPCPRMTLLAGRHGQCSVYPGRISIFHSRIFFQIIRQ